MPASNTGGFTLLEVAIVVAVFGLVIATGSSLLISSTKLYQSGIKQQDSIVKFATCINKIEKFLGNASLIQSSDDIGGTWINFQVPTKVGSSYLKIVEGADGSSVCHGPYWGDGIDVDLASYDQTRMIRFKFVPASGSSIVKESVVNCDINGDGDKVDEFECGRIVKVYVSGNPSVEIANTSADINYGKWLLRETNSSLAACSPASKRQPLFTRMNATFTAPDTTSGPNIRVMLFALEKHPNTIQAIRRTLLIAPLNQNSPKSYTPE